MNKCYVQLVGGLGNQLFQIACGFAYSKKYNKELYLYVDRWNAHQGNHPSQYENTIFKNFKFCSSLDGQIEEYNEPKFNYIEIPKYDGNVLLSGFYQSLKNFNDFKDEIISLIDLPKINYNPSEFEVAMHIRRGDYLQFYDIHNICSLEYFEKCLKFFDETVKIHAFTDSKTFVLEEFKNFSKDINIINTNSELEDLSLMSKYKKIICSNSSFSWWASLLGAEKDLILVPDIWFKNYENHEDIYMDKFTKIKI